uniref:Cytochrome b6/f complex subunit VI n=1 Tax=Selaginella nummulariifolia TaxID=1715387 RepID=A0A650FGZ8_9TRAC|nr:cytochrome b6/f complex subunit VI [Selaginella nummulariifolia]
MSTIPNHPGFPSAALAPAPAPVPSTGLNKIKIPR